VVILVTLGLKFFARGMLSVSAVLIGLLAGYLWRFDGHGEVEGIAGSWGARRPSPCRPLQFGFEFSVAAIIGFCLMAFVSAVETVGDVSGHHQGRRRARGDRQGDPGRDLCRRARHGGRGRVRRPAQHLVQPECGLIAMTGVMSRHVVTIGALFLILCGLVPKVGAVIRTIPIEVLGGGVIVMFGMVVAAGVSMLSDVNWNRRNMVIFAIALSIGLGLQLEPGGAIPARHAAVLMTSGLLPAALIAIVLNLVLPEELAAEATEEVSGGMAGQARRAWSPPWRAGKSRRRPR
jgi:xanthine/uracil permease